MRPDDGEFPPLERELTAYEVRARNLLVAGPVDFIHNRCFDEPEQRGLILSAMPKTKGKFQKSKPPAGLRPYLADLYNNTVLLAREQEVHQFRKMNFQKFLYNKVLSNLEPVLPTIERLEEAEALRNGYLEVHRHIVHANLRLVVALVRDTRKKGYYLERDFFEMVSDGNVTLMSAVDRFDFARGTKFSSYASSSILKGLASGLSGDNVPQAEGAGGEYGTTIANWLNQVPDRRSNETEELTREERIVQAVGMLIDSLKDERHRKILILRYGLFGVPEKTLEEVGRELGITKERVRQLEGRAEEKLKEAALRLRFTLP